MFITQRVWMRMSSASCVDHVGRHEDASRGERGHGSGSGRVHSQALVYSGGTAHRLHGGGRVRLLAEVADLERQLNQAVARLSGVGQAGRSRAPRRRACTRNGEQVLVGAAKKSRAATVRSRKKFTKRLGLGGAHSSFHFNEGKSVSTSLRTLDHSRSSSSTRWHSTPQRVDVTSTCTSLCRRLPRRSRSQAPTEEAWRGHDWCRSAETLPSTDTRTNAFARCPHRGSTPRTTCVNGLVSEVAASTSQGWHEHPLSACTNARGRR